jgi:hypothetical protein
MPTQKTLMLAIITSGLSVTLIDIAFEDYTTSSEANFLSSLEEFQIRIKEWSDSWVDFNSIKAVNDEIAKNPFWSFLHAHMSKETNDDRWIFNEWSYGFCESKNPIPLFVFGLWGGC